jgi:hypothetical protein
MTSVQLAAMRTSASATGRTFKPSLSRGEAWRRIREATALLDSATRAACAPPWAHQRLGKATNPRAKALRARAPLAAKPAVG